MALIKFKENSTYYDERKHKPQISVKGQLTQHATQEEYRASLYSHYYNFTNFPSPHYLYNGGNFCPWNRPSYFCILFWISYPNAISTTDAHLPIYLFVYERFLAHTWPLFRMNFELVNFLHLCISRLSFEALIFITTYLMKQFLLDELVKCRTYCLISFSIYL